jgi:hypothetical protein
MWCYPRRTSDGARAAALAATVMLAAVSPDLYAGTIRIASATYGDACDARAGNLTSDAASSCNNRDTCAYVVHAAAKPAAQAVVNPVVNPVAHAAPAACGNRFAIEWQCGDAQPHVAHVNGSDAGSSGTLVISCVTYGGAGH